MTVSPFVTTSFNQKRPMDYIYHTPVYDPTDANDDGVPDNPGNVLYYQENYSNNKDSLGLNFGFALTFNIPLDNRFQDSCLNAANTQINLQKQELNAKLLTDPEALAEGAAVFEVLANTGLPNRLIARR